MRKMIILRGNDAEAGTFPDETGKKIAWPDGALHVAAAEDYARRWRFLPIVLDIPGKPQNQKSPQANETVARFLKDPEIKGLFGFSGGGYNVKHILDRLADEAPGEMQRIELVVVLGAPRPDPTELEAKSFDARLKKKGAPAASWQLVYKTNPPADHPVVPKRKPPLDSHMFGPEWLLYDMPAGRYRDVPLSVED